MNNEIETIDKINLLEKEQKCRTKKCRKKCRTVKVKNVDKIKRKCRTKCVGKKYEQMNNERNYRQNVEQLNVEQKMIKQM